MKYHREQEFKNPGARYRGAPFWAWNTKLEKELLLKQVEIFKQMGFGGYFIHTRVGLDTPYLGEEFLQRVRDCVEKGKKLGLLTYLYDEDRWPSGYAGGQVTKEPAYRVKHLLFTQKPYDGGSRELSQSYGANFATGVRTGQGILLACYDVVLDENGMLKDYRRIAEHEKPRGAKWYAYVEDNPEHPWYNGTTYVDVLNKEAIDCFLNKTHEVYSKVLGDEFGNSVPAIFTDEPHMLFKTNLKSAFSTEDVFLPWTEDILPLSRKECRIDLLNYLPELFWELGEGEYSYPRYCYHKLLSDLFETAYAKNIGDWCRANGIAFTGHYLYEETLFQQNRSDGDLLRMYRHMDLPGMDLLFNEVDLTTAKQVQSIVRQYGKQGAASELYGVTNWSFDFRGYKFQGDWQAALGITLRVPHLALMTLAGEMKRDFPASIFYQAPWYREFKQIEDHFARVNLILQQGRPRVRLAVIHPIESYWMAYGPEDQTGACRQNMDQEFLNLTNWLLLSGIDFDFLSEGLLPELYADCRDPLRAGQMRYEMILVPNCLSLRKSTIKTLARVAEAGGKVVIAGNTPQVSHGIKLDEFPCAMNGTMLRVPFEQSCILSAVEGLREIEIRKENGMLHEGFVYQLREVGQDRLLFLAHVKEPTDRDISVKEKLSIFIRGEYVPVCYDTVTGEIHELNAVYRDGKTMVRKDLYPYDSLLLWLKAGRVSSRSRTAARELTWHRVPLEEEVSYGLDEPNVLLLDMARASLDKGPYESLEEILRIDTALRGRLGFPLRNYTMEQPYTRSVNPPEHSVCLKYYIESEIELPNVSLALENREQSEVEWNGEPVPMIQTGWYVDEKIQRINLGKLRRGKNVLTLCLPYGETVGLEPIYLLGDFGVKVTGRKAMVAEKLRKIAFAPLVGQNLDFYSGNISYILQVDCPEGKIKIRAPKYRGALIGIDIDNVRMGSIIFPPYEFEITDLSPGMHQVKLCLFGNRENTFSHLHTTDPSSGNRSFPYLWRTVGDAWRYEYNLSDFGILQTPAIYV